MVYFWMRISFPGIANEMGGITLIPISMNLGQPCKMEAQAPCHSQVNQVQEVHLSSASKPKKTGSLALFYRKVSVFIRESCCTSVHGHAETCLFVQFSLLSVFAYLSFGMSSSYIPGRSREKMLSSVAENPISPPSPPHEMFHLFFLFLLISSFYK